MKPNGTATRAAAGRRNSLASLHAGSNQALLRQLLAAGVQPKLTVGSAHSPLENEADRVADQVMRMSEPVTQAAVQRKCSCGVNVATDDACESCQRLQASPNSISRKELLERSERQPTVTTTEKVTEAAFKPAAQRIIALVGGGGDDTIAPLLGGSPVRHSGSKRENGSLQRDGSLEWEVRNRFNGDYVEYFTWTDDAKAADWIATRKQWSPTALVWIVGHSYGGDTAMDIATLVKSRSVTVDQAITLDPVSWFESPRPDNVKHWANAHVVGGVENVADFIAVLGGRWGEEEGALNVPVGDEKTGSPIRHEDAKGMFLRVLEELRKKQPAEQFPRPEEAKTHSMPANLQRKSLGTESVMTAPPIINEVLNSPGQPLDSASRAFFEPRLGQDLSHVRVHTDKQSADSAAAIGARAYTWGSHIAFAIQQYQPTSNLGKQLLAHELAHVRQQSRIAGPDRLLQRRGPLTSRPVQTSLRPVPASSSIRTMPGATSVPMNWAPAPYDDSWEAMLQRESIRSCAERERAHEERPVATLDRGGAASRFITERGERVHSWLGGPSGGGSVTVRVRQFHVLDSLEYAVQRATTEEDLKAVLERHVPSVAFMDGAIDEFPRTRTKYPRPISLGLIEDMPRFADGFDPNAEVRLEVFQSAVERRAQEVPHLAQSRLVPKSKKLRGCRLVLTAPLGNDPLSAIYCHAVTGSPYSYKINVSNKRWAEIDALRGNTWYECKCGYEALLEGKRGRGRAAGMLDGLTKQVLSHVHIAKECGLQYRYIVSNERVAEILRNEWLGNVTIEVREWEPCD